MKKLSTPSVDLLSKLTTVQFIVLLYLAAICFSTALLSLPIAHKPDVDLSFIDILFTAVSAISVTGLTVVSTAETFSTTGIFFLAFILQFGGIGIMALGTFIWLMLGKKIGLRERRLIMIDQNRLTFSGIVKLMKQILIIIMSIEMIGTLVLGTYFLNYFPSWQEAYFHGFFAAVSATTNAGFDITGSSLVPFVDDYFVQSVNMILIVLGAIGFPVLIEVKDFLTYKGETPYRFSLFTKLTATTFFALVIIGTVLIYVLELNRYLTDKTWHESLFYSMFHSVSARSGGLATMDINEFSTPTLLVLSALMFIGASPSSVGGGIRTTTFAIIVLSIIFYAKGRNSIKIFKREIHPDDIFKSFIVFGTAMFICFISFIILASTESEFTLMEIIFEICSAFGTAGLSMGITPELSTIGKIVIIILMFTGRIGIFPFLFLIRGTVVQETYHYPKERVTIG